MIRPIVLALFLGMVSCSWGDPRPLTFTVTPGGAAVLELQPSTRQVDAQPRAPTSSYRLSTDIETVHYYLIRRPPFDDMPLTVQWDAAAGSWERQTPTGLVMLGPQASFELARTVRLRTVPDGAEVSAGTTQLAVKNGRVTLPAAWHPPPLTLSSTLFEPYVLSIPEGALDNPDTSYPSAPVWLAPRFGPLSYWQFDVVGLLLGLAALVRRGRRPQVRPPTPVVTIDKPLTRPEPPAGSMDWVRDQPLVTEGGRSLSVGEQIGKGGVGLVFAAFAPQFDGRLAVKVWFPDQYSEPEAHERFRREARLCSTLRHPALVRVLDWGMAHSPGGEACAFLVMERVEGQTLRVRMRSGALSVAESLGLTMQLLIALEAIHQAGVIHRDLKPDNVMQLPDGGLKLMDFGVARELGAADLTRTGAVVGTPAYMSPEHFDARSVRPASDVYSAGVVLYEMLSGDKPYHGSNLWALGGSILTGRIVPLQDKAPQVPPRLCAVVHKMMATKPADRYQTAAEALQAVRSVMR